MKTNAFILITVIFIIFFSSVLLTNVNAVSEKTSIEVKSRMLTNEKIPIIVMLKDKSSFQTLLKENGISVLKDKSASSQHNIAVLLNEEKKIDKADKIKQFWIVNAIAVNASPELIEKLSARDDVKSIELDSQVHMIEDYSVQVSRGQIDTATTEIKRINATRVWDTGIDGAGINVSVIDTGIYATHPDISGRVIKWVDYVSSNGSPYDDNGHGTHVAGTVGGNGAGGTTTGVAPNVSLFGAKVLDSNGNGQSSNVIKAIEWSVENKADIISLSLGGERDTAMKNAINNAIGAGVTVIAAAGNCGPGSNPSNCPILGSGLISFPAGEKNVIAVGAVDSSDNIANFSSRGPIIVDGENLTKPDISAPGYSIKSLNYSSNNYRFMSGTSMATPHVSGTVALMIQNARIHNINLTPLQIINILANTSLDLGTAEKDNIFGWGRIDAYNATMFITDSPSVIANPTGYQSWQAAKNGSIVTINVTISDNYGIKNASVNISAINNSLPSIDLSYFEGFWKGNVTVDAIDGTYKLNVTAYDLSNNINNTTRTIVTVDNTPPLVNELSVSSEVINRTNSVNITANISSSDNVSRVNQSELFVRVIYPNGTSIDYNLSYGSGSLFYKNFTDTAHYGRYNITILANDTTGNTNSSQRTQFITTYLTNLVVIITGGKTETLTVAPYSNTSLRLNVKNSITGTINISRSKVNLTSNALGVANPGIYVLVNANASIRDNISYVILSVNYTDADVSSYVESSLRLYRWNTTSLSWDKLSGAGSYPYVNDAGVDTINRFVWANLTNLSEFALTGDIYVPPTQQSQGGGGGGGGGGGASGENYSNIEVTEKHDMSIYKDKVTLYRFTNNSNPIEFVNIIGYVNFGDITTSVEVLRNTSTMVNTEPPGIIYKNANIWVGSSSFNSPKNIKTGTIRIRVLNKWIKENNIESVRMVKWNKIDWEYIETNEFSKDDLFTYYDAFARVFSNFAITGTEKGIEKGTGIKEIQSVTLVGPEPAQSATPVIDPTEPAKKNPGFGSILAILCLWGVYIFRRGSKKS